MAETLHEARIILPETDNYFHGIASAHDELLWSLIHEFGGATVTSGNGAWKSPQGRVVQERVSIYDVAVPYSGATTGQRAVDDEIMDQKLRGIARVARINGRQECVYLRLPNGVVEFI